MIYIAAVAFSGFVLNGVKIASIYPTIGHYE